MTEAENQPIRSDIVVPPVIVFSFHDVLTHFDPDYNFSYSFENDDILHELLCSGIDVVVLSDQSVWEINSALFNRADPGTVAFYADSFGRIGKYSVIGINSEESTAGLVDGITTDIDGASNTQREIWRQELEEIVLNLNENYFDRVIPIGSGIGIAVEIVSQQTGSQVPSTGFSIEAYVEETLSIWMENNPESCNYQVGPTTRSNALRIQPVGLKTHEQSVKYLNKRFSDRDVVFIGSRDKDGKIEEALFSAFDDIEVFAIDVDSKLNGHTPMRTQNVLAKDQLKEFLRLGLNITPDRAIDSPQGGLTIEHSTIQSRPMSRKL